MRASESCVNNRKKREVSILKEIKSDTMSLTSPLKETKNTSYYGIFVASIVLGPFLVIAILACANNFLPASDADAFKKPLLAVWAWIASTSGITTLLGGLMRTNGRIAVQRMLAMIGMGDELPDNWHEVKDGNEVIDSVEDVRGAGETGADESERDFGRNSHFN